jgi:cullin-associated NEDD8-dissociated protein 1
VRQVKTFALVAASRLNVQLTIPTPGGPVLELAVHELCSFLRKSNRPLRQASLSALDVIIATHAHDLPDGDVAATIIELSALVTDNDLHVAHLALTLGRTITIMKRTAMVAPLKDVLLPKTLTLLQSSLLQGVALRSLLGFLGQLVAERLPTLGFEELMRSLLHLPEEGSLSRHALAALSQAIATCCSRTEPQQAADMVEQFASQLTGGGGVLALLCLGEIGRLINLSSHTSLLPAIVSGFDAPDDEMRSAASYALGSIAAGNPAAFVPHLLQRMETASTHDYLILHALKEMLGSGGDNLAAHAPQLLPKLLEFAERDEEGVRNVVAECLGRLAAVAPETVVPHLGTLHTSSSSATRFTVISCLRFAITELGHLPLPAVLQGALLSFLMMLEDVDLKVRRGALLTLNCLAHNKPAAIRELLPTLLPMLYGETAKRPELVHQVDLGPFKHTVDDGLDLRKAAFECMETILARCADRLEFSSFLMHLLGGLRDDGDIKLLCHRMLMSVLRSRISGLA